MRACVSPTAEILANDIVDVTTAACAELSSIERLSVSSAVMPVQPCEDLGVASLFLPKSSSVASQREIRSEENRSCVGGGRRAARSMARPWAGGMRDQLSSLRTALTPVIQQNPGVVGAVLAVISGKTCSGLTIEY